MNKIAARYTILIIDDDVADVALYKELLKSLPERPEYVFEIAQTGKEGLKIFDALAPDCVLLDYNLPDVTGLDLLQKLREISAILPVVMLTAQGNEAIAAETIKSGAQNYMSKNGITGESLHQAIQNTIERARLLEEVDEKNRQLEASKLRAEKADRSKSEFLATMSHEIRTPLSGIIGMAELLSHTTLNQKQQKYLSSIATSGELLLTIINDILDLSKIEAGDMQLEEEHLELKPLIAEIVQLLSTRANQNNVELTVRWPDSDDIPPIKSDAVRIRQILINLVGNAIKFTRDGHVIIRVNADKPDSDGKTALHFAVEDNGIGIPEDKLEYIFDRFSQVDSSTTRKYGGSGLGLAICKRLINMMGGKISVESTIDKGSTFSFNIEAIISDQPCHHTGEQIEALKYKRNSLFETPMEGATAEHTENTAHSTPLPEINAHILIVDDDRISTRMSKSILDELECSYKIAGNGLEAFETLAKDPTAFDLILMDWQMPVMDGHEAIREIRKQEWGKELKIVALTANAVQGDRDKCIAVGANDYLSKPVRLGEILAVLNTYIDQDKTRVA